MSNAETNTPLDPPLARERYCSVAFPPYRFVPGRFPHPTAHPDGHSYHPPGSPPPAVTFVDEHHWQESEDYFYGADLYNYGYWWEAHEAWEGLWQLTDKKACQGRFLQGMIQVSACHLKRYLGQPRGVERLLRTSLDYLRGVVRESNADLFMGLDLRGFIASVESYYSDFAVDDPVPAHDPAQYPYVEFSYV